MFTRVLWKQTNSTAKGEGGGQLSSRITFFPWPRRSETNSWLHRYHFGRRIPLLQQSVTFYWPFQISVPSRLVQDGIKEANFHWASENTLYFDGPPAEFIVNLTSFLPSFLPSRAPSNSIATFDTFDWFGSVLVENTDATEHSKRKALDRIFTDKLTRSLIIIPAPCAPDWLEFSTNVRIAISASLSSCVLDVLALRLVFLAVFSYQEYSRKIRYPEKLWALTYPLPSARRGSTKTFKRAGVEFSATKQERATDSPCQI